VQISICSDHFKQLVEHLVQILLISTKISGVQEDFHVFDSNLINVLGFPLLSNSEQESQEVEFVHVAHGNTQFCHVLVVTSPYVPVGQLFVHRSPTKNWASGFPHKVQLALFTVLQAPQLFKQGSQIPPIST